MKLRYLFSMILASVLLFAGCAMEEPTNSFDNIKLDKTYLVIPEDGGSVQLTIDATEAWAFDTTYTQDVWPTVITRKKNDAGESYVSKYEASWLSVDVMSAEAGQTVVTFQADTVAGGRELELCIKAGVNSQFLRVRQGSMASVSATCAEIIAGPDGKTYKTKGTVTSIANTTYGNWYLNDGTGEVYVYGTLDKDGKTKNFASLGIEVGDIVEVEGPKLTYGTTVELVDVTVLSIQKSLLKIITEETKFEKEGGEFEIKAAFKGDGLYPVVADTCQTWVSIKGVKTYAGTPTKIEPNPADTAIVTLNIEPYDGYAPRSGFVTLTSASGKSTSNMVFNIVQKGNIPDATPIGEVAGKEYVYVEGTVTALCTRGYILSDATGSLLIYYGSSYAGGHEIGDKMGILGPVSVYNYASQIQTIDFEQKLSEKPETVTYPEAVVYDGAKVNALMETLAPKAADKDKEAVLKIEYIKVVGKLVVSGNYLNLEIPGTNGYQGSIYNAIESLNLKSFDGKVVELSGYSSSVSNSSNAPKYLNIIVTSVAEASDVVIPELKFSKTSDSVAADATSYSFDITSNLDWTLTASEGVTLDKTSGKGNATVTMTFAANTAIDELKYTVTAKGQGVADVVLTLTHAGIKTPTIAEVRAAEAGAQVMTVGTVMATHQKGFIISDETGSIYVYQNAAPEVVVGNKVSVSGSFANYYGTLQIASPTIEVTDNSTTAPAYPTPVDLTDQTVYDAYATFSADAPTDYAYIKIEGVLSDDGRTITVGTSTKTSQLDWSNGDYSALKGKTVVVTAFIKGFHSKGYYQLIETSVVEADAAVEEPETPAVMTLTNAEICAAMTSSATSYVEYTINSASGVWTVNASQLTGNTFLQCRGRKGSYIKTPEFEKDIKSVTLHFAPSKSVYADNVYCVFPASWTAPTEDAAYPETGNVGRAVTVADSYTLTIPVEAGNKQVCVSIIGTYSYYLDHIDVEL